MPFHCCRPSLSNRYAARARDIKNVPHRVIEAGDSGAGRNEGLGGPSLRGTVDEIESLRSKLVETTEVSLFLVLGVNP